MFWRIFLFELRVRLRARSTWFVFVILAVKTFTDYLSGYWDAVIGSGVARNSPYSAYLMFIYSAFWAGTLGAGMMTAPLLRDLHTRTGVLVYSKPIGDLTYFLAKYLAGLLVFAVVLAGVYAGYALVEPLGRAFSLVPAQELMPTPWAQSVHAFILATGAAVFVWGTLHYCVAAWTGRPAASYVTAAALFMVFIVIDTVFGRGVDARTISQVLDPLGKAAFDGQASYWSTDERNLNFVSMTGTLLMNRALYMGASAAFLAITAWRFDLSAFLARARRNERSTSDIQQSTASTTFAGVRTREPLAVTGGLRYHIGLAVTSGRRQFLHLTREAPLRVALLVLVALSASAAGNMGGYFTPPEGRLLPIAMVALRSIVTSVYVPALLLVLFFAGDIVARDRSNRTLPLVDSTPAPLWSRILAHLVANACLILLVAALPVAALVLVQLSLGVIEPQPYHILQGTLLMLAPSIALYSVLPVLWYAITGSRTQAQALGIVSAMGVIIFHEVGAIEHHLLLYGFPYESYYSGFSAAGSLIQRQLLTWVYWAGLASMLLVVAYWIWPEGIEVDWRRRRAQIRARILWTSGGLAACGLLVCAGTGLWLLRAINVQGAYASIDRKDRDNAEYERRYQTTAATPQPKIVSARLVLDLLRATHALNYQSRFTVVNPWNEQIEQLHVEMPDYALVRSVAWNGRPLVPRSRDELLRHDIYRIDPPLGSRERAILSFDVHLQYAGFSNSGHHGTIVADGSLIGPAMLPTFGYNRARENRTIGVRRRHGFGARETLPPARAGHLVLNVATSDDADHVELETVVRAPRDQLALAPGTVLGVTEEGDTRVFSFRTERAVPWNPYIVAARFGRADAEWTQGSGPPVQIEILHTPAHDWNVPRFIDAAKAALDHFSTRYGSYPYRSMRIVEVPDRFSDVETSGNLILIPERQGWLHDYRTKPSFDWIQFVVARAMARTWWGDMMPAANVQGASLLTDALPTYEALSLIEARHGADQVKRYLRTAADDYLKQRALDDAGERSLLESDGQHYLILRGTMTLWEVDAMVGRIHLTQLLRQFWTEHARSEPPYADAARLVDTLTESVEPRQRQHVTSLFTDAQVNVDAAGRLIDRTPADNGGDVRPSTAR